MYDETYEAGVQRVLKQGPEDTDAMPTSDPALVIGAHYKSDDGDTCAPSCVLCDDDVPVLFAPAQQWGDPDGWPHIDGICATCAERAARVWKAYLTPPKEVTP